MKTLSLLACAVLLAPGPVLACDTCKKTQPAPGQRVVEYDLFTPRQGCEDVAENYCVTRYVLCADGARTKVAIVQRDDRPDAFVPESLANILISLKAVAEED